MPDATPVPTPAFGLFGKPLEQAGEGELKEPSPDGGYIFWRIEKINGKEAWIPFRTEQPDKHIQA